MGALGMSEWEYYTNPPYVNFCKAEGYYDKQDETERMLRNQAQILYNAQGGKGSLVDYWHIWGDKQTSTGGPSWRETPKEERMKILRAHGLIPN